ncbi:HAD-like domain-containing protein [Blakeslea trispora]|nr:HAD-like domain-containing protein [Blakeslea trispora]
MKAKFSLFLFCFLFCFNFLFCLTMTPTVVNDAKSYHHIKMVASDLDGTLIVGGFNGGRMTERTIKSLQDLENKGMQIVLASGRPPRSFFPLAAQADLKQPIIISCNGGLVLDNKTKDVIRKYSIANEAVRDLIRTVKAHFDPRDILIGGESGTSFRCEENYAEKRRTWVPKNYVRVDDLDHFATEENTIEKLMLLHREWIAEDLYNYLKEHVLTDPKWKDMIHYTFSSPHFVEVSAVGVCKATALKDVCEELGIKREEVIAFGDMPNDCEMLEFAGTGVAMGNAHQQVKDVADLITLDNIKDGVAVILEEISQQI